MKNAKGKKVFIGAKLSQATAEKLRDSARRERRSVSNMLEVFLERGDNHLFHEAQQS